MTFRIVHTLIKPCAVKVPPIRTKTYTLPQSIVTPLTSLEISAGMISPMDSSPSTSTLTPSWPADVSSSLPNGRPWNSTPAQMALVAVIVFGVVLLSAISYFIFLHFRGRCPNCAHYEDELQKWKCGDLKRITPTIVQGRMLSWDLENGGMNLEAKMKADRMESLASLEGRSEAGWSVGGEQAKKKQDQHLLYSQSFDALKKLPPAHLADFIAMDARRIRGECASARVTIDNYTYPATYSAYLRDVAARREAGNKRSMQEKAFKKLCNTASDHTNRESGLRRTVVEFREAIRARKEELEPLPPPSPFSIYSQDPEEEKKQEQTLEPVTYREPTSQ